MTRRDGARASRSASSAPSTKVGALPGQGWDKRLYPGLQLTAVAHEQRGPLVRSLGEIGVEAEYMLGLLRDFPGTTDPSPEAGDDFLARLEGFGMRLIPAAAQFEVAAQSYQTALEAAYPELATPTPAAEPWWPAFAGYVPPGEPIELRLRRCGFAYRHVVAVRLPSTIEAITEQMALVLHALGSLPPAGVAPVRSLAQGLSELADALQGDVVPHHIRDVSPEFPGLLSAIERLRALRATEDTAIAADLVWAREQYAATGGAGEEPKQGLLARLFGRSTAESASGIKDPVREWRELIGALEALRTRDAARAKR